MSLLRTRILGIRPRPAALATLVLLVGAACGAGPAIEQAGVAPTASTIAAEQQAPVAPAPAAPVDQPAGSTALADLITELPPAPIGEPPPEPTGPNPIGLTIGSLGVDTAAVIGVGVEENGDMEVPPADKVGWYRFGPAPGEQGSAVLAAHIAFDGVNGVFVELNELELGSPIVVSYDDGTTAEFVAVDKQQYDKTQLPKESIFARDGSPQLVLITCGGEFNRSLRSYRDNIVVYAEPVTRS